MEVIMYRIIGNRSCNVYYVEEYKQNFLSKILSFFIPGYIPQYNWVKVIPYEDERWADFFPNSTEAANFIRKKNLRNEEFNEIYRTNSNGNFINQEEHIL